MFTPKVVPVESSRQPEQQQQQPAHYFGPYWTIAAYVWLVLLFWTLLFGLLWF